MAIQRFKTAACKTLGVAVCTAMVLGAGALTLPVNAQAEDQTSTSSGSSTSGVTASTAASWVNSDVQVIAFQQTWNTIAKECKDTYGPEGVGYVEVSPPQESIKGSSWWTSYQPVSYKLDSKLGSEQEFKNMITVCKAQHVGIIADVVMNNTAAPDNKGTFTGTNGSQYTPDTGSFPGFATPTYPDGLTATDFHTCTKQIADYKNQEEVQQCRLNGILDFDSESDKVQDIEADYMARMYNYGVIGFRIDAAKHINTDSLHALKAKLAQKIGKNASDIYWIQEGHRQCFRTAGIQPPHYTQNGTVTEFGFKSEMSQAFNNNVTSLKDLAKRLSGDLSSNDANVFVTNWDTERDNGTITYKDSGKYQLANAFMLAYGYGTPRLMSGYKFDNRDAGAPGATDTTVPDVDMNKACSTNTGDWNCEQRWTSTRGMIKFHNYVGDTAVSPVKDWQSNGNDSIAFSRGTKGFLALNNGTKALDVTYDTTLPDGEYCNVFSTQDCSQTVTVSGGKVKTTIPARSAIALYGGATKASHQAASATTDPSDPKVEIKDEAVKPTDTTLTVYYKNDNGYKQPYIHYGVGETWTVVPGEAMTYDKTSGYWKYTIETGGNAVQYVFNDGSNSWDNPNGGGNYKAAKGIVQQTVTDHASTVGSPKTYHQNGKTRLVVHYKAPAGDKDRALWVWGSNANTSANLGGKQFDFTGTDCWGKVADITIDGAYTDLGVIVKGKDDWDKVGENNRNVKVAADGTAEIWVDGTASDLEQTLTAAPADYISSCKGYDVNVTVHYYREDGLYFNAGDTTNKTPQWDLWTWSGSGSVDSQHNLTSHDDWGEISTWTLKNYKYPTDTSSGASDIGLLRRYGGDAWIKEPDGGNHFIPADSLVFDSATKTGKAEVWLVAGDPTVYTAQPSLTVSVRSAEIADAKKIAVKLSGEPSGDVTATVTDENRKTVDVADVKVDKATVTVTTKDDLAVDGAYTVTVTNDKGEKIGSATAVAGAIVRTDDFDKTYAYDGGDLGATWTKSKTTFKVWAPTAKGVDLVVYKSDTSADADQAYTSPMTKGDKGVWSVPIDGDLKDTAYQYRLTFADGTVNYSPDPYATAAVVNGKRSVVLSDAEKSIKDFNRMPSCSSSNAVIAETHHPRSDQERQLRSCQKPIAASTSVLSKRVPRILKARRPVLTTSSSWASPTCRSSRCSTMRASMRPRHWMIPTTTWGYDPENYNVPEGSYSSNASDPATRIVEAKEMVNGLHNNGLRVIMDVVYNHVADASTNPFNLTVPGYYFRYNADGSMVNNSGCGNDTASERAMMRKYIVDSVTYWAKNYNVDGFRFDLMGLEDLETMKAVRAALDKIDPGIIIVGEGWDMNSTMDKSKMSIQPNAYELDNTGFNGTKTGSTVSFFNDSIRDGLRGSVFSDTDTGFVSGKAGQEKLILHNMLGCPYDTSKGATTCWNGNAQDHYQTASQVVQYAEIHDNPTLYDKLVKSVPNDDEATRTKRAELADSAVFLAQGISEIQLGQEFLRTKNGDGNSYKSGDSVNAIDWDRLNDANYGANAEYVKGLIALRKKIAAFRMSSYDQIAQNTKVLEAKDGVVAYQVKDDDGTYVVVLNANDTDATVSGLTAGDYKLLVSDGTVTADPSAAKTTTVSDAGYTVPALSAAVLAFAPKGATDTPGDNTGNKAAQQPTQKPAQKPKDNKSAAQAANKPADLAKTGASVAGAILVCMALALAGAMSLAGERKARNGSHRD
ncbi:alpha-amylase family glycosyl hydrolase [Bifidobacterium thermacidophilum]|uniref:Alpha-amylase n=1 Tax=Bifidobacterium thermacidophilum subsp. thermacidophilum TaxID=79262 RepID=A0A087E1N9_9BIFI|nr:Amylopullulanase [Bifidobacterium thermacidophilum subsp. thermacidophilum]